MKIDQGHIHILSNLDGLKYAEVYPRVPDTVYPKASSFKDYPFTTKPILTQVLAQAIYYSIDKLEPSLHGKIFVGFAGTGGSVVVNSLYSHALVEGDIPPELVHFQKLNEETHRAPFHSTTTIGQEGIIDLIIVDDHVNSGATICGMMLRAIQWVYSEIDFNVWEAAIIVIKDRLRFHVITPLFHGLTMDFNEETNMPATFDVLLNRLREMSKSEEFTMQTIWDVITPEAMIDMLVSLTIIHDPTPQNMKLTIIDKQETV